MQYYDIKNTDYKASAVAMGCMHLVELSAGEARALIQTAMDAGVNFFDHADVYGGGECETLFAEAMPMNADLREQMILQSKCGIVATKGDKAYFDFSKEHIVKATEGILRRLKTEYLDVLLLHRPDTLMEPEEVAEAFEHLHGRGMVRYFGVSNQNPMQMELLQKYCKQKLAFNQLQFSMAHTPMVDSGLTVNMSIDQSINREGSILEYCRLNDVTIQAWSPFQRGFFEGVFLGDVEHYAELNEKIDELAEKYNTTDTAIAVAWILRHPAHMQVITGTTKPQRVKDCAAGADIVLTKQEWYEVYEAAGNVVP